MASYARLLIVLPEQRKVPSTGSIQLTRHCSGICEWAGDWSRRIKAELGLKQWKGWLEIDAVASRAQWSNVILAYLQRFPNMDCRYFGEVLDILAYYQGYFGRHWHRKRHRKRERLREPDIKHIFQHCYTTSKKSLNKHLKRYAWMYQRDPMWGWNGEKSNQRDEMCCKIPILPKKTFDESSRLLH